VLRVCQSLASIVQNVEQNLLLLVMYATYLLLRPIKYCSVVFVGVTLKLFVINMSSSSSGTNKLRRLLPAISVASCGTASVGGVLIAPGRLQR